MSVVIVGGHDRMVRQYMDICKKYNCKGKVFTQLPGNFKGQIGQADLIILFTSTVSHIMVNGAVQEAEKTNISDAYKSGDTSKLTDKEKETLDMAKKAIKDMKIKDSMSDFEKDLLYFASPALLGRKQANLFSFSINCLTDYRKEIDRYKKELAPLGISVEYLYCKKQRVYLLVYRKDMMLHYFKQPAVKEFLIKQGYPETPDEEASLYETLCILRKRIIQGAEFPHEIGFFFGYPAEDVFAFIREKGHNYKLVGDWKVYGDGKAALHTFRSYARCRKRLMEQASAGADIVSILTPARTGAAI